MKSSGTCAGCPSLLSGVGGAVSRAPLAAGNSFESCLVAILVPREGPLRKLAEEEGISGAADAPLKARVRMRQRSARMSFRQATAPSGVGFVISVARAAAKTPLAKGPADPHALPSPCCFQRLQDLLSNSTLNAAVLKKLQATGRAGKLKVRRAHSLGVWCHHRSEQHPLRPRPGCAGL